MRPFLGRRSFMSCPSPPSWGGCLWFGPVIRVLSRSAIATAAATAPIAMITPSPGLTAELGQGMAAPCTLWILGHWVGPATREAEWSAVYDLFIYCYYLLFNHYYTLLHSLLLHGSLPMETLAIGTVLTLLLRVSLWSLISEMMSFVCSDSCDDMKN